MNVLFSIYYLSFKYSSLPIISRRFTLHFELHRKYYLSQRGLVKLMEKCQWLLLYLSKQN
ncbi:hypothetical protein Patl1_15682 [Pistacia atlantica]|uniref:Uncharacterized protein n=1 Tax=Pistacia atlantica TaxID=434234 RepID=A0ACC1B930_9ROSI|nr:hypothetical protein Patl1_15682 [Pistacia atlantica]